jgi:cyclohexa-1,5-dienecarbonyl-CoA hydratase
MTQTLTQSAQARIVVDVNPPVTRIGLRHPPLNVIDIPMMEELSQALAVIESRPDISLIVISGEGSNFSAGVDVAAHTPDKIAEMLTKFHAVIRALVASRKVTIASVRGHCLGGGAEVAMVCDLVYTSDSAQWGFPEIKLACFPPVACAALAALVGQKRAAELILTGRTVSGIEAADMGLATRAWPADQIASAVDDCLRRLKEFSGAALAPTKNAMCAWDSMHFEKGLERAERIYLDELMATADAREGISAFLEKRSPQWMKPK